MRFASVSVSLLMWKFPASSTLNTTCVRSGGGGSVIWSGGMSSGTRTPISFSISGVSTMKMMSSTSTTSTSGVMLMSERTPPLLPTSIPICLRLHSRMLRGLERARVGERLVETAFLEEEVDQLVGGVGDVDGHLVDAVGQVVVHHQGRDRDEQTESGRDQRLRDAGRHRRQTAGAGGCHQLEGG